MYTNSDCKQDFGFTKNYKLIYVVTLLDFKTIARKTDRQIHFIQSKMDLFSNIENQQQKIQIA
jgi:hypothetical protein